MTKKAQEETIIDVLNGIIEEEEEKIRASYPQNDAFQKKMALFELIRSKKNRDSDHYY